MYFIYSATAEIDELGDVMFEIEGDEQLFSFRAGLSYIILPMFFSDITAMLHGKIHAFEVHGNEAMTYYNFEINGNKIRIEEKD